ncbi:MAG: sel1 repeat family protein [Clostridia bacterium]|nr:sel1 repeat family protein [Clostridia bacterium]
MDGVHITELKRLADAGNPEAAEHLGEEYIHGNEVPVDEALALHYSQVAAEAGRPRAMTNMGILALHQEKDEEARRWFETATEKGDMKAPRYLGLMYLEGKIPSEEALQAARQAFLTGADRGDITSQYHLGVIYEQGIGVTPDLAEAIRWYRISAQRGDKIAKPAMDALERLDVK